MSHLWSGEEDRLTKVRDYWEKLPCGSEGDPFSPGTPEYFRWISDQRYAREPFIEKYAKFDEWSGRDVLEVGMGAGSDAERFARAGARYVGVDLTEAGVALTRRRFELGGLPGKIERANAEDLPCCDASFDLVWSWGVIHHSARTEAAAAELQRVCRPGGRVCCMVYNRRSLYALQGWIVYGLLRGRPFRSLDRIASEHFESPGTRLLTEQEFRGMFPSLDEVVVRTELTPYDLRVSRRIFLPAAARRLFPNRFGYFMVLSGRRRSTGPSIS